MSRVICIGNRLVANDDFGPRVYDALAAMERPPGIELVDGGLAGLNLLRHLDDGQAALFIDNVAGYTTPGELVVIEGDELGRQPTATYGHQAGLPFLVQVLPQVVDHPPSRIRLLGCEGCASDATVVAAARLGLQLAQEAL